MSNGAHRCSIASRLPTPPPWVSDRTGSSSSSTSVSASASSAGSDEGAPADEGAVARSVAEFVLDATAPPPPGSVECRRCARVDAKVDACEVCSLGIRHFDGVWVIVGDLFAQGPGAGAAAPGEARDDDGVVRALRLCFYHTLECQGDHDRAPPSPHGAVLSVRTGLRRRGLRFVCAECIATGACGTSEDVAAAYAHVADCLGMPWRCAPERASRRRSHFARVKEEPASGDHAFAVEAFVRKSRRRRTRVENGVFAVPVPLREAGDDV